ncbi:extracellular solute-binding protein [Flavimaricola marinus]|uniref:Bacterial extracellular solute-binding proteins, family 5 Middle n=1 Tax=Flavimaricola marinus TaxID=1819565 RepID=A0A238LBF7_9RHOB|nr:extracellular solute-binding protein [Flavimaricola marinus]SMY06735.1 Bacterial extracellular solute-binding proteins, family 5 Middle [Flavimaricola marinus]
MPNRSENSSAAAVQSAALAGALSRPFLLGSAVVIAGALWAGQAWSQDVTVSHGYSNFGALKYDADFPHLDYVNPDAPKGGEISIWSQGSFDSFNPYARVGVGAALATIGGEAVLTSTADDPYGMYCFLCTSMEYPEDLSFVTYNLRDDVTFSDGRPMTAEDVEFSFNLFLEQGISEYRSVRQGWVTDIAIESPYRITFTFSDLIPEREKISYTGGIPVFSKAWFEETGTRLDESIDAPFLTTGAYVLESFDYNRQVIYARNPDYWGAEIPFNIGRNNFDRIRVEYFADGSAAFEGFKAGEYTFRTENSSRDWATGYDFPALQSGYVVQEEIPDGSVGTAQSFVFNLDTPKWQDPRVREAIGMMFNFEWSNETLFYGLYARPQGFWPNTDLGAVGAPTPEEVALLQPLVDDGLLDASILTDEAPLAPVNGVENNTPARSVYRAAGQLLDDAGWVAGDDGMRRKDGQLLEVVFLQRSPLFDRIVNPYIENLERLGVAAKLDRVDTAQYVERLRSGDFDLANHSIAMGFEPGFELEQWFASTTADDSSRNLMRLRSDAVDRMIPNVTGAETLEELKIATRAFDRVLRAEKFTVPQWFNDQNWVAYYDMYRHPEELPPLATGELDFWWFDAEAAAALEAAGAI